MEELPGAGEGEEAACQQSPCHYPQAEWVHQEGFRVPGAVHGVRVRPPAPVRQSIPDHPGALPATEIHVREQGVPGERPDHEP